MYDIQLHRGDLPQDVAEATRRVARVACDIETSGLDWSTERIGTFQLFIAEYNAVHVVLIDETPPNRLRLLIADQSVTKIFHHAMFDLRFMGHQWGATARAIRCTKIASKVLSPNLEKHSLKALGTRWLGVDIDKSLQASDWTSGALSPGQLRYAAADVLYLPLLMERLEKELEYAGRWEIAQQCFEFIPTRVGLDLIGAGDVFSY